MPNCSKDTASFIARALAQFRSAGLGPATTEQPGRLLWLLALFLTIFAGFQVVVVALLWGNHIGFPLNLEAMELAVLQHLEKAMIGSPLFVEPTSEFAAFPYTPLYYYLSVPFAWLFGVNLATLRLVAIIGAVGAGVVIFVAVRRNTGSPWWGLMALGLFAASYRAMDTYLDNAHSDTWFLFSVMLGLLLIDWNRSLRWDLLGLLLVAISFWFKQHGALFAIGALVYLTWHHGWKKSWPFWLLAIMVGPVTYIVAGPPLFGPLFYYYTWVIPRQWIEYDLSSVGRLGRYIGRFYFLLAVSAFARLGYSLLKPRSRLTIWLFMLPVALLSGFMGSLDLENNNNVLIPLATWLIIAGVIGLKALVNQFPRPRLRGLALVALLLSFALLIYNPVSVMVSPQAAATYQDMAAYLNALDGTVYAPWIGPLQDDAYSFSPTVHWVPLYDLIRGPGIDVRNHPNTRRLLAPVLEPEGNAYILTNYPLEQDAVIGLLAADYVLESDLGERFATLGTLPKRYNLQYPRYLYRYAPVGASGSLDNLSEEQTQDP